MKIYSDSLQDKIDEFEKSKIGYKEKIKSLAEQVKKSSGSSDKPDKRDQEIQSLKLEILQNNQLLKSYEENNLKMSELEKKLRMQNHKHEKDLKAVEEKYTEKIKSLQKKLLQYEDIIKNTNKLPDTANYATKYSHRGGDDGKLTDRESNRDNSADSYYGTNRPKNKNISITTMMKQQRQSSLSNDIKDTTEKKQIDLFNQMLKKNTNDVRK